MSGNGSSAKARIAVLGASGYTGEEVVRLLALHPNFEVTVLTGESQAGKVSVRHYRILDGKACDIIWSVSCE